MAGENTAVSLTNLFQESYPKEVLQVFPDYTYIVKNVPFRGAEAATGGKFIQPVILTREHGWTYGSANSGALYLAGATPLTSTRMELVGSQLVGQAAIDYEAAARAQKSKASFVEATELIVENLMESGAFRMEVMFLYGQDGLAYAAAGSTGTKFVVSDATWCPAMFPGLEGAPVAVYQSNGTFRLHTTISSVNYDTKEITLADSVTGMAAGDILGFRNGWNGANSALSRECMGLKKILSETANLFGVSLTNYPVLKGNIVANGGAALSITAVLNAILKGVNKGLKGDVTVLVSPKAWQDLVNPVVDPKAQFGNSNGKSGPVIMKDGDGRKIEFGVESIVIHSQAGKATITPHLLVRDGDAFIVPMKLLKRVGAQELSFTTPGRSDEIFVHSATLGAYELRCYANQALFVEKPSHCIYMNGIA